MFGFNKSQGQGDSVFSKIMENKKILPMLIEYPPFIELSKYINTKQMKIITELIKEAEKEEKQQILEVNNLHKEKSKIAPTVLYLSSQVNSANNKSAEKELEDVKNKMLEINEEIEKREALIQELLVNREERNMELLRETLNAAYEVIKNDEKRLNPLLKEIESMRKQLEEKRVLRDELQARVKTTYDFIHGFMGGKDTEKFDEQMLDKKE